MGNPPERDEGEVSPLDDLGSRLKRARGAQPVEPDPVTPRSGLATALRLAAEMISALIVGGASGGFSTSGSTPGRGCCWSFSCSEPLQAC